MTILDSLIAEFPPITTDPDGVQRVGKTRVRLATVVNAFNKGLGAEEILLKYPSLELTDIYSVLAYYLRHRQVIDIILSEQSARSDAAMREIQERFPSIGVRERLLARRNNSPAAEG